MSKIEWTDETWNPIIGCSKISPGCLNCYAERMAKRQTHMRPGCGYVKVIGENGKWNGRTALVKSATEKPFKRKPRRIFVCSMGDLFHKSVFEAQIDIVFGIISRTRQHTFQVLTKRPERMREYINKPRLSLKKHRERAEFDTRAPYPYPLPLQFPYLNLHLGVTVENQKQADLRIPQLLETPAAVRFLSAEPMLGAMNIEKYLKRGGCDYAPRCSCDRYADKDGRGGGCAAGVFIESRNPRIDWVIVGGETGPGARPMDLDWARDVRDQCIAANVPFFFKGAGTTTLPKSHPDYHLLDGQEWKQFPTERREK